MVFPLVCSVVRRGSDLGTAETAVHEVHTQTKVSPWKRGGRIPFLSRRDVLRSSAHRFRGCVTVLAGDDDSFILSLFSYAKTYF